MVCTFTATNHCAASVGKALYTPLNTEIHIFDKREPGFRPPVGKRIHLISSLALFRQLQTGFTIPAGILMGKVRPKSMYTSLKNCFYNQFLA